MPDKRVLKSSQGQPRSSNTAPKPLAPKESAKQTRAIRTQSVQKYDVPKHVRQVRNKEITPFLKQNPAEQQPVTF